MGFSGNSVKARGTSPIVAKGVGGFKERDAVLHRKQHFLYSFF